LDGLRGILAIILVAFHILQLFYPSTATLPLHHGYLAVDFFFMRSGFIIGMPMTTAGLPFEKKTFLQPG
jgi:peptidoglycan/LPS O-acetylase OafA/YrhL